MQLRPKPIQICYLGPRSYFNRVRLCFPGVHRIHVAYSEIQFQRQSRKKVLDLKTLGRLNWAVVSGRGVEGRHEIYHARHQVSSNLVPAEISRLISFLQKSKRRRVNELGGGRRGSRHPRPRVVKSFPILGAIM